MHISFVCKLWMRTGPPSQWTLSASFSYFTRTRTDADATLCVTANDWTARRWCFLLNHCSCNVRVMVVMCALRM